MIPIVHLILLEGTMIKIRRSPAVIKDDKDAKFKKIKTKEDDSFLMAVLLISTALLLFLYFYLIVVMVLPKNPVVSSNEAKKHAKRVGWRVHV